jgi:hypothetical protein
MPVTRSAAWNLWAARSIRQPPVRTSIDEWSARDVARHDRRAGSSVPSCPGQSSSDVVVVGAGLAGLTAALHWAGTETATYRHGSMDGAITSGRRAAAEVLDA